MLLLISFFSEGFDLWFGRFGQRLSLVWIHTVPSLPPLQSPLLTHLPSPYHLSLSLLPVPPPHFPTHSIHTYPPLPTSPCTHLSSSPQPLLLFHLLLSPLTSTHRHPSVSSTSPTHHPTLIPPISPHLSLLSFSHPPPSSLLNPHFTFHLPIHPLLTLFTHIPSPFPNVPSPSSTHPSYHSPLLITSPFPLLLTSLIHLTYFSPPTQLFYTYIHSHSPPLSPPTSPPSSTFLSSLSLTFLTHP